MLTWQLIENFNLVKILFKQRITTKTELKLKLIKNPHKK